MINPKKVKDLLAECDLAEADLAGDIRRTTKKPTDYKAKLTPINAKAKSWLKFEMNGDTGDASLGVSNMDLKNSVGALARAAINLIRAEHKQRGDTDIHPPLSQFIEIVTTEAEIVHRAWHEDPKNNSEKH